MSRPLFERSARDVTGLAERLRGHVSGPAAAPAPLFGRSEPTPSRPPYAADPADIERRLAEVREQALRDGRAEMQGAVDAMEARLAGALDRLDRAAREAARPSAIEIVELALIAADEIVGRALELDRTLLVQAIDGALAAAGEDAGGATVRLAPEDAAWLREHDHDHYRSLRMIEDSTIEPGGCVVASTRRFVDATIEARLDAVRVAIRAALGAHA